jgi:hypothetical protein
MSEPENATQASIRIELDILDRKVRGAEESVAEAAEHFSQAKSHLRKLKIKRNKLRMEFKLTEE